MNRYEAFKLERGILIDRIHTFFKSEFKSDYIFHGERHDFWELVFVLGGNVGVTADEDVYVLQKGQAIIHRPNEFHKIWSESGTNPTVVVISFSATVFPEIHGRIISLDTIQMKKIENLCLKSHRCIKRNSIDFENCELVNTFEAQEMWLELELFVMAAVSNRSPVKSIPLKSAEFYSSAVRLMKENVSKNYCIDEIAKELSISSAYLKKIFVKYSGCGVMKYYNQLKANIACTHLDSGKSVKETAMLLGFNDQNYFSTFFKRIIGRSPSEFKNKKYNMD